MAPGITTGRFMLSGSAMPKMPSTFWKYPDQPLATVAALTAYSSVRSQPITQAKSSPSVA